MSGSLVTSGADKDPERSTSEAAAGLTSEEMAQAGSPLVLVRKASQPTLKQLHRAKAENLAESYWNRHGGATLAAAVKYIQGRTDPFNGKTYQDSTIENWIRKKNPLYTGGQPGRKEKKTK